MLKFLIVVVLLIGVVDGGTWDLYGGLNNTVPATTPSDKDPNVLKLTIINDGLPELILAWKDNDTGRWFIGYYKEHGDIESYTSDETGHATIR